MLRDRRNPGTKDLKSKGLDSSGSISCKDIFKDGFEPDDGYMTDEVLVIYGDCLDVMGHMTGECVDMVFADPPYNISRSEGLGWAFSSHVTMQEAWDIFEEDEFFQFNVRWIGECIRLLRPTGTIFVSGSYHNIFQVGFILQSLGLKVLNDIVWFKPNAQPNITCRMFTQSTETIIWAAKEGRWTFNYETMKKLNKGKQMRNMWKIPYPSSKERWAGRHPTQKPVKLLERIVLASTEMGDLILDPFLGSGTTAVVSRDQGRRCVGIEKETRYGTLIEKRLEEQIARKDVIISLDKWMR